MRVFILAALAASILASASQAATPRPKPRGADVPDFPVTAQIAQTQSGFEAWVRGFRKKALSKGISARTFDRAFRGVRLNARVVKADRKQSEFTSQIWDYIDIATSPKRVENGKDKFHKFRRKLLALEKHYQVDAKVIVAIWGLESTYGERLGDINVVEALATLAYDGRRRSFGEQQLLEALKIIQAGDIGPNNMLGSWAGAMGHTQFIPTSYQAYAQDFDGDGRRDVWNPRNPIDALASTANYLKRFGWRMGHPWGIEVKVPAGFNFGNASNKIKRPVSRWMQLGVRTISGKALPNYGEAAIFAPAGAKGPVFAVFKNFFVIKRYNNADSYALGVGHLGDKITGGGEFKARWPRGEKALTLTQRIEMQKLLTRKGFDTQGADGMVGPNTIAAIRAFQQSRGVVPDGFATTDLLKLLK